MPIPAYTVHCTGNERIAASVHELRFRRPADFNFAPGQFVLFSVPLSTDAADLQPRAYSIASVPEEADLRFVIKLKEGGRASTWVEQQLRQGTDVQMQGPLGMFCFDTQWPGNALFLCTGAGIAPFRSMILHALQAGYPRRIDLVMGCPTQRHLFWQGELAALAQQYPQFHFHTILSEPEGEWQGMRGFVQDAVPTAVPDYRERSIYVCGNPFMTGVVKDLALSAWGIPKERFHMEGYI